MLALISFILTLVGCANWLTIGLLQFDFVAGVFGSQSNIFSRIIYVLVGIAAIVLAVNIIKNKGNVGFDFKKEHKAHKPAMQMEAGQDNYKTQNHNYNNYSNHNYPQHHNQQSHQKEMKNISDQLSTKHNEHKNNQ